jgi:GTP-binding protein HflX
MPEIQEFMKPAKKIETSPKERALLVQLVHGRQDRDEAADSLLELERLADTAGAAVVGVITQRRDRPTPNFLIGEGKLADVQLACRQAKANMVIFDNELSPVQVNNIDLAIGIKVIDRTELILQIFARRARSAESQVQVELAQLEYLVSRVPVSERQARFSGGIGMKGPGESPFQMRKAVMQRRMRDLKEKLKAIQQRSERTRVRRQWPLACLVGYTNAGKSTLLNTLAGSDAYVDDRLFATLDTKTRMVYLAEGKNVLMADTVGFIRNLPHGLVASFKSTLDVAVNANLLLIVVDSDHMRSGDHLRVVHETLKEIGADKVPSLLLLNKCDSPEAQKNLPDLVATHPDAIQISAMNGDGLDKVKQIMIERLAGIFEIGDKHPRWTRHTEIAE